MKGGKFLLSFLNVETRLDIAKNAFQMFFVCFVLGTGLRPFLTEKPCFSFVPIQLMLLSQKHYSFYIPRHYLPGGF